MGLEIAWLGMAGTFLLSTVLVGVVRRIVSRHGVVDHPGERRLHSVPTPRGGGLGFILAWCLWLVWIALTADWGAVWPIWLVVLVLAIALLGLWDDLRTLPPQYRIAGQSAVVAGVLVVLDGFAPEGGVGMMWWVWQILGFLGLLWVVNLYNFMDGIDGIAAWEGIFAAGIMALTALAHGDLLVGLSGLGLVAAVAGFLPWNIPPARIFMGDTGSTALGFALGALAMFGIERGTFSIWIPIAALSVFVVDATATLLMRIVRGERWYTAHRSHTYQLLAARRGHGEVVLGYMTLNFLLVAPLVWWMHDSGTVQPWTCIGLLVILFILWGIARRS